MADATMKGRADLAAWRAAQPEDLYEDDTVFQALVEWHRMRVREPALHAAGRAVAGPLDEAVQENNLARNLPVLDDWDGVGRQTGVIHHHPSWFAAGRLVYGTGVMAAYAEQPNPHRFILSLFYLTAQAGEAGHNCPLACAAGAIRAVQGVGTDDQRARYLPRLLDSDFDRNYTAAQLLTEVQGGSDVGANATIAMPVEPDRLGPGSRWRITGEKWFCSSADADVFVVTARVSAPESGTRGLGLFLVSRLDEDGRPNGFRIRRLKDKIGTRSMASAEIDFDGAIGEALGPVQRGFKNVMERVINTSRLYNAMACAGHARRAYVVARTYARHRRAFGQPIGEFAQVAETIAWIRADAAASLASTLWLAQLQERQDAGTAALEELGFLRVALNLNKLRTAVLSHGAVNGGIEVLGGNGAIESFSVLPRLLRDNIVFENWEGTPNVLRAQVLRDARRLDVHRGFFSVLEGRLGQQFGAALAADRAAFEVLLHAEDAAVADLRFRRLACRLATWVMVAALLPVEALSDELALTFRHLFPLQVDAAYLARVRRLSS